MEGTFVAKVRPRDFGSESGLTVSITTKRAVKCRNSLHFFGPDDGGYLHESLDIVT